jgi:hypothetical protein
MNKDKYPMYPRGSMSPTIMSYDLNLNDKALYNFNNLLKKNQINSKEDKNKEKIKKCRSFISCMLLINKEN